MCDLEIEVTTLQVEANLFLLAEFEVKTQLPTHQNIPNWFFNVKRSGSYLISANHSTFKDRPNKSKGTFIIAMHGHSNVSYTITVNTI